MWETLDEIILASARLYPHLWTRAYRLGAGAQVIDVQGTTARGLTCEVADSQFRLPQPQPQSQNGARWITVQYSKECMHKYTCTAT